jgi:hypothetical protein
MNISIAGCWPALVRGVRPVRLLAGGSALVLALGAAASPHPAPQHVTSYPGQLLGVSAVSPSFAWAVGYRRTAAGLRTLALRWDGTGWAAVATPNPGDGRQSMLDAVTTLSPTDAWAVGSYSIGSGFKTLALHWNGTRWTQVPSPSPEVADGSFLLGVSAVSGTDVWAAGWYFGTGGENSNTLLLHWNGARWSVVRSPNPVHLGFNTLTSVSARSGADAWAAGSSDAGTITLHWDGSRWSRVASPGRTGVDVLNGVSAVAARDAWAAGATAASDLILRWNGVRWARVPAPAPGSSPSLSGVSAASAASAWAVGAYLTTPGRTAATLVLHWNGTAWARQASPSPGGAGGSALLGVSAPSPARAWAVGYAGGSTLILRWNGTAWVRS